MKTSVAIQCIVLLACMALCTSHFIPRCRCLKPSKSVRGPITEVTVHEPRPYCNRREVIVTLKDGSERCLDPQSKFIIMLLEKLRQKKSQHKTTVSPQTTTSSATVSNSL
ncbi:growth-regulated alpha protein-like [Astatotilapia calliptera]|uniref:growth-regulated alpha protein-like n=1 Tax=Astatotilapia calliptera TaxID=8154 RepID=UPI000E3FCF7E|nr:growth-regulated alpha protein-like [Astatotilapia calliptera]